GATIGVTEDGEGAADDAFEHRQGAAATASAAGDGEIPLVVADERLGRAVERGDDDAPGLTGGNGATLGVHHLHQHVLGVDVQGAGRATMGDVPGLDGAVVLD